MGRLGHGVGFQNRSGESAFELAHGRRRQGRAARADESKARLLGSAITVGAKQQHLMNGRRRGIPGDSVSLDRRPKRLGAESTGKHQRRAGPQRRQSGADESVDVKQGHDHQANVVGTELIMAGDIADRRHQVAVSQRHALGPAGGSARVQEQGQVFAAWRFECSSPTGRSCALQLHAPPSISGRGPDGQVQISGRTPGRHLRSWRHDQGPAAGIVQGEAETPSAL